MGPNDVNDPTPQNLHLSRRKMLTALGSMACAGLLLGVLPRTASATGLSLMESRGGATEQPGPVSISSLTASGVDDGWANVFDYGAAGDGVTDDTAAFQAAAATGKAMLVPKPAVSYRLTGSIALTNSIVGVGMPELWMDGANGSAAKRMLRIEGYAGGGLAVTGLHLNGKYTGGSLDEQSHLVRIVNSKNVHVQGNWLDAPYGDCVYIGSDYAAPSENIHVEGNVLSNPRRCAVAVVSGKAVWIRGNYMSDPYPYVACIDLEPNASATGSDVVEDIWIEGNEFYSEIYWINSYNPNTSFRNTRIGIANNRGRSRYFFRCNSAPGDTENVTIRDNEFYGSVSDARMILASKVVSGLEISGNRDYATGAAGWSISSTLAPVVRDNVIESSRAVAVTFQSCEAVQFIGNRIRNVGSTDGAVRFAGTTATSRHLIAGNQLLNGTVGYWIGAVVTNALFDGNSTECSSKHLQLDAAAAGSDLRITANNVFSGSGTVVTNAAALSRWAAPDVYAKGAFAGWGLAPPTTGVWKRGSVLLNALPAAGAPAGWFCVGEATAPGEWEPFGNVGEASLTLRAPNGSRYAVSVDNAGVLTTTLL